MRAHDVQAGPPRKDVSNPEDNVPLIITGV